MDESIKSVADRAGAWALANHPSASPYRHAAFVNGVTRLVTGQTGGYGGPSIREHAIMLLSEGPMQIEEAIALAAPIAFGRLEPELARKIARSHRSVDDDPTDLYEFKVCPDILQIVDAWEGGNHGRAIALTEMWRARQNDRFCVVCGDLLATTAKGDYCKNDREKNPNRRGKKK